MSFKLVLIMLLQLGLVGCASINKMLYEKKCVAGDWDGVGYQDGSSGKSSNEVASWSERCTAFNVKPNKEQYSKGHARGVTDYCTNQGKKLAGEGKEMRSPSRCLSRNNVTAFENAYKSELKYFCTYEKGIEVGKAGALLTKACTNNSSFKKGYAAGLSNYCTEKNANDLGKANTPFNVTHCSSVDKSKLQTAYDAGKRINEVKAKIKKLDSEISSLETKLYDPKVPGDAKAHYRTILVSKKSELRALERESYQLER